MIKKELIISFLLAAIIVCIFWFFQSFDILPNINGENLSIIAILLLGFTASISTCMATVGGLLLSMTANYSKNNYKIKPQIMFHIGRLISFFLLGGVIGLAGSLFTINFYVNFWLNMLIGLVVLFLGLRLLDVSWAKKIKIKFPEKFSQIIKTRSQNGSGHFVTPFIIGVVTFFLPCGFTQSMQIYTLSVGGFLSGALTMFLFAIGTLPVLILLGLSPKYNENKFSSRIFFKTVGFIVILFGLFNIMNSVSMIY